MAARNLDALTVMIWRRVCSGCDFKWLWMEETALQKLHYFRFASQHFLHVKKWAIPWTEAEHRNKVLQWVLHSEWFGSPNMHGRLCWSPLYGLWLSQSNNGGEASFGLRLILLKTPRYKYCLYRIHIILLRFIQESSIPPVSDPPPSPYPSWLHCSKCFAHTSLHAC